MKLIMKKKYRLLSVIIIVIAALFFGVYRFTKRPPVVSQEKPAPPIKVTVQSGGASNSLTQNIQYPATVVGDQEIKLTAKSSGTAQEVNFNLGEKVGADSILAKIDDTGNNLAIGDEGFRSAKVQQAQLAVDQVEEQLKLNKKTYNKLNNAYQAQKKNPKLTKTVTKTQLIAAKGQIEISEVQLENAKVGLEGGLDDHLITSPIAGYITSKSVSAGDSIALGQQLATISKTDNLKIQFYVNQDQLTSINEGMEVAVSDNSGNSFSATVKNISPDADPTTKRFLIEALPNSGNSGKLFSGIIVTVSFSVTKKPQNSGDLILPLSAITIGQNESYLFLADNGKAKKITLTVRNVEGEMVEIRADIPNNAMIIIDGNKLVRDGGEIQVQN